ncbi:Putative deoxyribose-phosphate aldolase [Papilio machaon]|uniref:deoxyribose-phosphate aldolase n=1 Tax=Papilio machaon TaxID=76193 RepID=A0A194R641_PAPMA|nr:Putative deoxyribose-phosphate aldolase [Papilio machaon]
MQSSIKNIITSLCLSAVEHMLSPIPSTVCGPLLFRIQQFPATRSRAMDIISEKFMNNVYVNKNSLENQIRCILNDYPVVENETLKPWLLQIISVIDLTTLSGDDTRSNVIRLCQKAANPLKCDLLNKLGIDNNKLKTAAVCVYPARVPDAYDIIKQMGLTDTIQIASAILITQVYKASMISMSAGADFIKTSTGKESVNATLPVGLVMCRAIRNFYQLTGVKVGLKPAGGIKTARDAINWLVLVYTELGPEWITPDLFRIGASSLLDVVEKSLDNCTKVAPKGDLR